jgi:hypothetical protein
MIELTELHLVIDGHSSRDRREEMDDLKIWRRTSSPWSLRGSTGTACVDKLPDMDDVLTEWVMGITSGRVENIRETFNPHRGSFIRITKK